LGFRPGGLTHGKPPVQSDLLSTLGLTGVSEGPPLALPGLALAEPPRLLAPSGAIRKVAFFGGYPPRQCGIATFTHDVHASVARLCPPSSCVVAAVNDVPDGYDYGPQVRYQFQQNREESYREIAEVLNRDHFDVACLQHEYGIFGGPAGEYIVTLLRNLRMPIVTTLHTVLSEPNDDQERVLLEIARLSERLVVMTERSRSILMDRFRVPASKIDLIVHGIPDMPEDINPTRCKEKLGVGGKLVALTFGLLSPNKGIEYMLRAMPEIVREFPTFVYVVLGATHPHLIRQQGERYRESLEDLARELGITDYVLFENRFVDLKELTEYIAAADVYVTPYLNPAQSVSGTLAYSFGCGKAVVSTPYWHAEELLADGRGVIVPFADSQAIAREVGGLLRDETRLNQMRRRAFELGREMIWPRVGEVYMSSFQEARRSRSQELAERLRGHGRRPSGSLASSG
jgi:glycosyltransferase involved in cell wall biosynthesis